MLEEDEEAEGAEEPGRLSMMEVPAPHSTLTNSSSKPLDGTSSTWLAPCGVVRAGRAEGRAGDVRWQQLQPTGGLEPWLKRCLCGQRPVLPTNLANLQCCCCCC